MNYLRDAKIRGRKGRNVDRAVTKQGIKVKLVSRTSMAKLIIMFDSP